MVPKGIGGRETIELLTALDPAVTAIVASGYAQDPVMTNFKEYGFKGVIAKPFTLQELNQALNLAMARSMSAVATSTLATSTVGTSTVGTSTVH